MRILVLALALGVGTSEAADPAAGGVRAAACAGCHGADGNSTAPSWPKLAGQQAAYLEKQLADFQNGARVDPMMSGIVRGLTPDERSNVAAWYASRTIQPGPAVGDTATGARLYFQGRRDGGVPPCAACHGDDGRGSAGFGGGGFPALAGQHAPYTAAQLRALATGYRANDPGGMMRHVASKLSESEILAVAAYLQSMPSQP